MWGFVESAIESDQGVAAKIYPAATATRQDSGYLGTTWGTAVATRIVLAELRDRDRYLLEGREEEADFRALVKRGTAIGEGDGVQVDATAEHHAGRKFVVIAERDPEGQFQRLLLKSTPGAEFGT